ncbi:MFS transporter [Chryseosolibacter indicus]|uniref:MFS transporter n=1 Tax=Chryseosolibacter indicus TaxID=2782351 RepID=UPI0020B32520|nr:MFS transporter [Chryseosolibacter indicus]
MSVFYFLSGFCFSSWASRIPTIKAEFEFNEAELGTILLFMPFSSLCGIPISGWLVSRYDSRVPLTFAFVFLAVAIFGIGMATSTVALIASICLFAFSMRILNISMNTQAVGLQKLYEKRINGSFHGLWSTGGIVGVGFSTLLVGMKTDISVHLTVVALITLAVTFISFSNLIKNDRTTSGNKLNLRKPDPYIMYLGLLVLFASICEGGMFDWGGVYFREVVKVELFTLGYLLFMVCMAISRFASDRVIESIGLARTYILSSSLIIIGITLSVLFATFWTSLIGFCFVGFGTASIFPMTLLLAGSSKKYSPGMGISIVATYGIVGMFVGPALIGYLAHAFNLRLAFIAFGIAGLMLIPISQLFFKHQKREPEEKMV